MQKKSNKIVVVLGPTASGKSDLAVKLANKFNGEIISADSRQVYKGMDIGTGKVTNKEMMGIPHYLLDVVSPKKRFNAAQYRYLAGKKINEILHGEKLPILCGGTGFYIQTIVDGTSLPEVKPDWALRKKLSAKKTSELYKMLQDIDVERAKNIDRHNPRRLIRALEIVMKTKKNVPRLILEPKFDCLLIGIKKNPDELKKLIKNRLAKRLKQGMLNEVRKLHESGVSWKRLEEFGLEYRFGAMFLQKKISYPDMKVVLQKEIEHYSKRQLTWFNKDKRIVWIRNFDESARLVKNFIK